MLKKSSKYWLDRQAMEKEAIEKYIEQDQEAIAQLDRHYDVMLNNINQQIAAEISSLADRNNVGLELAKKQVTDMDVKAYSAKAKQIVEQAAVMRKTGHHVTYKDYPEAVNQELRVYNTTMRINRLEYLRANIALEVARASLNAASITGNTLVDRYIAETKRQSGILGISGKNDSMLNNAAIQGVVTADVNGANWSSRLWANQVGLRANLEQVFATGLAHFDIKRMQSLMTDTVHNWKYVADRLLNTEVSRVLYMAQWGSIKKAGYRFVKWINEPKACLLCSAIGREDSGFGSGVYEYDKVPSIPAQTHPNCRCAISAYWVDDKDNDVKKIGNEKKSASELFHKNSYHLPGTKYVSSYDLKKILRKFISRGGVVDMSKDVDRHLRSVSASASTLDSTHISLSSWATRSAIQEELYHTRQFKNAKKAMWELSEEETVNLEIEAQKYLLKNAKAMKFSYNEIKELEQNLNHWKTKKARIHHG